MKSLFVLTCAAVMTTAAQGQLSVALSDNVVILDDKARSSFFELVNLARDPTEFRLTVDESVKGTATDASSILRWAPQRSLVPGNRTIPVRISARPTPELTPGEYVFRVLVTAEVKPVPHQPRDNTAEAQPPDGFAVKIPVVPTLPVTVYLRHQIPAPMIDVGELELTPDDKEVLGYFPVRKRQPEYSFVGQVEVVDARSGKRINGGRLHIRPGGNGETRVKMPRGDTSAESDHYCLHVWDHFPARGTPMLVKCSG